MPLQCCRDGVCFGSGDHGKHCPMPCYLYDCTVCRTSSSNLNSQQCMEADVHCICRGGGGGFGSGDRSKSCPMPRFLKAGPTAPIIAEVVMKMFQKCGDAMPCTRLAVSASDFEDGPLTEGQGSITKFFGAGGEALIYSICMMMYMICHVFLI